MAKESVRRSPEVEAVVRRIWRAFVDGSEAAIRNLTSSDAGFRMILSADDQWFAGPDFAPMFAERGRVMDVERLEVERLEAYEKDDVGWVAAEVTVTTRSGFSGTF